MNQYPVVCYGVVAELGELKFKTTRLVKPLSHELLVKVQAAGVNRADIEQVKGHYLPPKGASNVIGLELAGVVIDKGDEVEDFAIGDRVMSLVAGGAYADYAVVPAQTTLKIPSLLSFEEAAAIPEAYCTVWQNVFRKGKLQSGEIFLVHGGASGIGSAAVQIAKSKGAIVIATVGCDRKKGACQKLGADHVINYKKNSFEEEVFQLTHHQGVDVILDWIGASYLSSHLRLLRPHGRLLCIDSQSTEGIVNFDLLLGKQLTMTGSLLRPLSLPEKSKITLDIRETLLPKLASGEIKPLIHAILPLTRAKEGHQMLEESSHIGKIVLSV